MPFFPHIGSFFPALIVNYPADNKNICRIGSHSVLFIAGDSFEILVDRIYHIFYVTGVYV